jgi:hypothetical protein
MCVWNMSSISWPHVEMTFVNLSLFTFYKSKKRPLADCKITEHALKH